MKSTPSATERRSDTCAQCGADLRGAPDQYGIARCEYCGASNRVADVKRENVRPVQPPQIGHPASDLTTTVDLPLEYARLSRPKPDAPLESSGCGAVFGLIWTLFSSIFLVVGVGIFVRDQMEYRKLSREGVPATAAVTQLEVEDSDDSTSYRVYYEFRAPVNGDPSRFEDSESVSSSFFSTLHVEQNIEVLYAASDPSVSAIKSEFGPPGVLLPLMFTGMGGLFTAIGLAMIYGSLKAWYHLGLLRSKGQTAMAYVFDRWTDKDSDGDTTYFVAFAFRTSSEQLISHAEQNQKLYQKYQIGDTLEVRYLPNTPSVCQPQTSL